MRTVNKVTAAVAGVAALVFSLGACSSSDDNTTPAASGTGSESAAATEAEVFTWWADGSEKAGLDALVAVFDTQHPNVKFVNAAVSGGGGSNAKPVLASRLASNDPPDSFQAHAGAELTDYINAGQVQDVSNLYDEFGLNDAFPADLISRLTVDGKIYSIPSNIHRANVTWANVALLKEAGLPTDAAAYESYTTDQWITALQQVKDKTGKTPLSVGGPWTQVQLLENVLIADLGADGYNGLWDGSTDWAGSDVTAALKNYEKLLSFTNEDRDGLDWAEPIASVESGDAAFNVMGDWAEAQFEADGKVLNTDYLAFPTPGTNGVFDFLADSFTLPVGAPHPDGAKAWLETIGSVDGQKAFNKAKGSIPARTDVDTSDFSEYQQTAIKSFANDTIVSSLAHGAAAPAAVLSDITDAISKFSAGSSSVEELQAALVTATKG